MKTLIVLSFILIYFGCKSGPGGTSIFLQGTFTKTQLLSNGFRGLGLTIGSSQGSGTIDNWLIKDENDTTVSYIFYGSILLAQRIEFSPAKIDTVSLFNFLQQLGFKKIGDTLTFHDINFEVKHDSTSIKFIREFPLSEKERIIVDSMFIYKH